MPRDSVETIRLRGAKAAFGDRSDKEFRTAAEEAPYMIRSLGLGAGIATLAAKKDKERRELAGMIAEWLFDANCPSRPFKLEEDEAEPESPEDWVRLLFKRIAACERATYRTAQIEALGFAVWLKRLAQAFCEKGDP